MDLPPLGAAPAVSTAPTAKQGTALGSAGAANQRSAVGSTGAAKQGSALGSVGAANQGLALGNAAGQPSVVSDGREGDDARQGGADATELAPIAERKGPGRPETNVVELAMRQWGQFCEAGAGSMFFGSDKSVACARAVARYIEKRKAKKGCELASKRLQAISLTTP